MAVTLTAIIAACSDAPRLSPSPDLEPELLAPPEPKVFASGTVTWGRGEDEHFDWKLEEVLGYGDAVTLTATTAAQISVRSISPEDVGDQMWFAGIVFSPGAPPIVFGGAIDDITDVVLVNDDGDEIDLDLVPIDREWHVGVQELPSDWYVEGDGQVVAVALDDGDEVSREPVAGLS